MLADFFVKPVKEQILNVSAAGADGVCMRKRGGVVNGRRAATNNFKQGTLLDERGEIVINRRTGDGRENFLGHLEDFLGGVMTGVLMQNI